MPLHTTRRRLLSTGSGAALAFIAGCSSKTGTQPLRLTVFNVTDSEHHVQVEISKGQAVVVQQEADIPAEQQSGGTKIVTTFKEFDAASSVELAIEVVLDSKHTESNTVTFSCSPENPSPNVICRITSNEEARIDSSCY